MSEFKLNAKKRDGIGKNKVDKLRVEKEIPGVIYARGKDTNTLTLDSKEFDKIYLNAGMSNIIDINIEGDVKPALIKEVQKHPFKNQYLHVDFMEVDMDTAMRVVIPVVLANRDSIRVQPSILLQIIDEVEIECLPANLPSEAIVNVQDMQIGETLLVKDLDIYNDAKVEIITDAEEPVATLSEPRDTETEEESDELEGGSMEVPTVKETEE